MKPIQQQIELKRNEDDGIVFYVDSNHGPLLFDTGAATSQLSKSEATAGFIIIDEKEAHGVIGSIKQYVVAVESLCIGSLCQFLPEVSLADYGILGMDFLHHYAIQLDFDRNQFSVIDSLSEGNPLRMGSRYHSYLPCEFAGTTVWGLFDTGASTTIVDENFAKTHPDCFSMIGTEMGTDMTGTQVASDLINIKSLVIANQAFDDHQGATVDLSFISQVSGFEVALIIGTSTILQKSWKFDYGKQLWQFV